MAEYIEREVAINALTAEALANCLDSVPTDIKSRYSRAARRVIVSVPTADVAPVVRCKNCDIHRYCKVSQYLGADGFCSNGEKVEVAE